MLVVVFMIHLNNSVLKTESGEMLCLETDIGSLQSSFCSQHHHGQEKVQVMQLRCPSESISLFTVHSILESSRFERATK